MNVTENVLEEFAGLISGLVDKRRKAKMKTETPEEEKKEGEEQDDESDILEALGSD